MAERYWRLIKLQDGKQWLDKALEVIRKSKHES